METDSIAEPQKDQKSQPGGGNAVEAQKLVLTDPVERNWLLRRLVNWEKSNATDVQKEQFLNNVLIPYSHIFSVKLKLLSSEWKCQNGLLCSKDHND